MKKLISKFIHYIKNVFRKEIKIEDVISYLEKDLNISLDHSSGSGSRYYKIGDFYIRISDHLQSKAKDCIGITLIDGGAFIHLFNRIITLKYLKDLKLFLWSFTSFYGSDKSFNLYGEMLNSLKSQIKSLNDTINSNGKRLKNQASEITKLIKINSDAKKDNQNLQNQIVNLHKQIAYINRTGPTKVKKTSTNLASVKNKLKVSETVCEDLMDLIYKISEHLDKLPEDLQSDILNYIGDYYDQK